MCLHTHFPPQMLITQADFTRIGLQNCFFSDTVDLFLLVEVFETVYRMLPQTYLDILKDGCVTVCGVGGHHLSFSHSRRGDLTEAVQTILILSMYLLLSIHINFWDI